MSDDDDSLQRVSVGPELEPMLRRYRRLWISRHDLDEARAAITKIYELDLRRPRRKQADPLLVALTTAMVVSYARPFVHSRGQGEVADRTVPGTLLRVLNSDERAFHDFLIRMRNREVAHSDAEQLELYLRVFPDGDGGISRVPRYPLYRTELKALRKIIVKLDAEIERLCEVLRRSLPHEVWI